MNLNFEQAKRALNEIKCVAGNASLTGKFSGGSGVLIKAYNDIFKHAVTKQWIANNGIVSEIDATQIDASDDRMDYVGCAAGLLMALMEDRE